MFKTVLNKNIIIVPIPKPKTQQRHGQGHLVHVHIPPLSGEEPSFLHNRKHTTHPCNTGTKQHTVTALNTLNNTVANGVQPNGSPCTVGLDMSKAFDSINIHTLIRKLLQTSIPGTIIKFIANYIKGHEAYTTYRNKPPDNVNLKLTFHKVASFHPHYLTFTLQTYNHPVHRFMSGLRR